MSSPVLLNCESGLNFDLSEALNSLGPRSWPDSLPGVAIDQCVIAGFQQKLFLQYHFLKDQGSQLIDLIFSVYPELSFVEICRFISFWNTHHCDELHRERQVEASAQLDIQKFSAAYKLRWDDQLDLIARALLETPLEFQKWCAQKQIGPQELAPLVLLNSHLDPKTHFLTDVCHRIIQLKMTRSQGSRFLELAVDLFLMGTDSEKILPDTTQTAEHALGQLEALRYPQSKLRDLEAQTAILKIPGISTKNFRWTRAGDRSGIEIKFFISNGKDLKRATQQLTEFETHLESFFDGN